MAFCIHLGHLPTTPEDCNFLLAPKPRSVSTASVPTEAVVGMGMENGDERGILQQLHRLCADQILFRLRLGRQPECRDPACAHLHMQFLPCHPHLTQVADFQRSWNFPSPIVTLKE